MKKSILAVTALLLLAACSSGNKISDKDVKKTVNKMYAEEPICLAVKMALDNRVLNPRYSFGDREVKIKYKDINGKKVNKSAVDQMDILKKQGFYKYVGAEKVKIQEKVFAVYKVWELTDKGERYFDKGSAVCIGHFELANILHYSIPASNLGRKVSYVTFTVQPKIDKWAKPFLKIVDTDYEEYFEREQEKSAVFYLTNKGWRVLRENI